ncbi:MAG: hypothetical protein PVG30_00985 [Gammaproteobacteria bacterium]|jgi:alpha-tubulin suppressor-like RCC1 family protein
MFNKKIIKTIKKTIKKIFKGKSRKIALEFGLLSGLFEQKSNDFISNIGSEIFAFVTAKTLVNICLAGYCKEKVNEQFCSNLDEDLSKENKCNEQSSFFTFFTFKKVAYQTLKEIGVKKQIFCGMNHTLVLCEDGKVLSFGNNNFGQLGRDTKRKPCSIPKPIDLKGKKAKQIFCGKNHTFILCANGKVLSFGDNFFGQLGRKTEKESCCIPKPIDLENKLKGKLKGKKAKQIFCGEKHTLILCTDGTVLSFGNNFYGQLGRKTKGNHPCCIPKPIGLKGKLKGKKAKQIFCGEKHTLILCTDGTVLSFGNNNFGQLGRDTKRKPCSIPKPIDLKGKKAKQIFCGKNHTFILCANGKVLSFGDNFFGQLGRKTEKESCCIPKPIDLKGKKAKQIFCETDENIVSYVYAKSKHLCCGHICYILCTDGTVLSFGNNNYGQLGRKTDEKLCRIPKLINLKGKKAQQVFCGKNHTLILCTDGTVLSFGNNNYGQLGRKTDEKLCRIPKLINLKGKKAQQVFCGESHTLILCTDGTVLSFGNNFYGQLGRKAKGESCRIPTPINLKGKEANSKFKLGNAVIRFS